ncbi:MarR family winged helix-turn-helix transcriptional regulator [Corynebacterium sputi]|uniref:MarR family winged helix-turn-helix transcriptional regulator n=1 Tax=Corynebacterium sputi TaxID=489915 RepID=UPI0003FA3DB7|nr:MarR family winged helix-turn-helix transcriptional regulator [Corynebacterium sputi]
MDNPLLDDLAYEHMLISRHALQGSSAHGREPALDRSATVLLARLAAQGPMSVAELADAFDLDISTVHRQVAAAMKHGLIERVGNREGGNARKHVPTDEGSRRLAAELDSRAEAVHKVVDQWDESELDQLVSLMRKFNRDVEKLRGRPWPRP